MNRFIKDLFSPKLKAKVRQSRWYSMRVAIKLAKSSKRLDICSSQFAHCLHLAGLKSLEGKVCMEIGAGWVLTHSLVCYLLGAERVIATDITSFAKPEILPHAIQNSILSISRDVLAPFSTHSKVRERLQKLERIRSFNFSTLRELGIEYASPIDLAAEKIDVAPDFIFSNSVLEHVPVDDTENLLQNLASLLQENGVMIHCIHLEDHINIRKSPFEFYTLPEEAYGRTLQTKRGNRIRSQEWVKTFGKLPGCRSKLIYSFSREDKELPADIDTSIKFSGTPDLRTSHIGVLTEKVAPVH